MPDNILAYDLGTGGNKASLYDAEGRCLASVFAAYDTEYPQTGWHEQRPAAWWDSVVQSTRQLLASGAADPQEGAGALGVVAFVGVRLRNGRTCF